MIPCPDFYDPQKVSTVYRVDYAQRSSAAVDYRSRYGIKPASLDIQKNLLLLIDVQNTFCIPEFELFVGGISGRGAVEDNQRLCDFIYHNLGMISDISVTLDTHTVMQIFHPLFFIDGFGNHPSPYTDIQLEDVLVGKWKFNPEIADHLGIRADYGQEILVHYAGSLQKSGRFALTVWPYHAMLGGIGHALVSSVEEAVFFHSIVRLSQPHFEIKGDRPFTENYSVIGPEVLNGPQGETLGLRNPYFIERLKKVDKLIIAGQAKSHCVSWTISDLMYDINLTDASLIDKVYLLEDCSSPVVVTGLVDHSLAADAAYKRFAAAGMHIVRSSDSIEDWN